MDWDQIKSIMEKAIEHGRDISITIEADGRKQIDITIPQACIVENNSRTKYIVDQ